MTIDSNNNDNGNSFEYRLKKVSDEEIITILRLREHFQPHAVKEAIKEALKRGIISSIEDLNKNEFKPQPLPPKSLFPVSAVESQNIAIFKSLCRISYIFGIIPLIYGVFQLSRNSFIIGSIALITGVLFIFITYKLERQRKPFLSQLLLFFNIPVIVFASIMLMKPGKTFTTMDLIATIIIITVFLYATIYLNKLTTLFNKNPEKN